MKPIPFLFLCAACAIGYAAYHHASDVEASIADAAVDAGFNQIGVDKPARKEIGKAVMRTANGVNAAFDAASDAQHVSAPAANVPVISANDAAIHDELRGEIEALKSRVGTLERQPPCTCARDAKAANAAPAVAEVPQVIYQDACANGNCSSGRRRGRWFK